MTSQLRSFRAYVALIADPEGEQKKKMKGRGVGGVWVKLRAANYIAFKINY